MVTSTSWGVSGCVICMPHPDMRVPCRSLEIDRVTLGPFRAARKHSKEVRLPRHQQHQLLAAEIVSLNHSCTASILEIASPLQWNSILFSDWAHILEPLSYRNGHGPYQASVAVLVCIAPDHPTCPSRAHSIIAFVNILCHAIALHPAEGCTYC